VFIILVILSYGIYVFEREIDFKGFLDGTLNKEYFYTDYIWLTFITLMTVGYGDMYPNTEQGKFIIMIVSIGGLFLTATLVGVINNVLELTFQEKNVISILNRD
jgi:hypothetical protein